MSDPTEVFPALRTLVRTDMITIRDITCGQSTEKSLDDLQVLQKLIERSVVAADTDCAVADGLAGFVVPASMNGFNLTGVTAANSVLGVTGSCDIQLRRVRQTAALGDSTTQFDITDQGGNTARYTYDGTGTDPVIADSLASLKAGDVLRIAAQNFNAGNNGTFTITAVDDDYFEVTNAALVAEANKTIGTGSIIPEKHRDMLSTKVTIGDELFASDGVVNTSYDDVQTGDMIYIDIDAIHSGTAAKGLSVSMEFEDASLSWT